jgi:hypothetical protein
VHDADCCRQETEVLRFGSAKLEEISLVYRGEYKEADQMRWPVALEWNVQIKILFSHDTGDGNACFFEG